MLRLGVLRKSSFSDKANGCVGVTPTAEGVEIEDDKLINGPVIVFSFEQWERWLREVVEDLPSNSNGAVTVTNPSPDVWMVRSNDATVSLIFNSAEWTAFRLGVEDGQFEHSASSVALSPLG